MHVNGQSSIPGQPRRLSEDAPSSAGSASATFGYDASDILEGGPGRASNLERRRGNRSPGQGLDAVLDIEAQPQEQPVGRLKRWWRACRAHPYLRYVPLYAACATTVGAYFGIRNWLFLDAAKTYGALQNLKPLLLQAHEQIACALASLQTHLNVTDRKIDCPQKPMG